MSTLLTTLRVSIFAVVSASVIIIGRADSLWAGDSLVLVGSPPTQASFVSATSNCTLDFQSPGQLQTLTTQSFLRWSSPLINRERDEILLTDGSRLVLAESWAESPSWQADDATVSVISRLLGHVDLPRNQVRAIVLRATTDRHRRTRFLDQLQSHQRETDSLFLTNGDQWQGLLIGPHRNQRGNQSVSWLLNNSRKSVQLPERRISAITLANPAVSRNQDAMLVIGLRDGSLLRAKSILANSEQLRVHLVSGIEVKGSNARDVVYLRSLTASCAYLSDLTAVDYQHLPYLKIPWNYRRDRNVLGGTLRATEANFSKGLGMPTAARLTYRLDSAEMANRFQSFVASVAVDDAAGSRGSVIFRVYLEHEGVWELAFASPVVRGGDPPIPVAIELRDAKRLALVTDFADRGDERDYANWLEARLE